MEKEAGFGQSGIKAFDRSMSQDLFSTYHVPAVIFHPVELQDRRSAFLHQGICCLNLDVTPAGTMKRSWICRTRTRDVEMHGNRCHTEEKERVQLGLGRAEEGEMETAFQSQLWP